MPRMEDRSQFGKIMAVDRANGVVRALLDPYDETTEEVVVPYNPGRMPWPLARAVFRESPRGIRCVGPIGHRRVLFHDDFLHVDPIILRESSSAVLGDTAWFATTAGIVTISQGSDGVGVANFAATGGSDFTIGKDDDAFSSPEDGYAHHWLVRFSGASAAVDYGPIGASVLFGGFGLDVDFGTTFRVVGQEGIAEEVEGTTFTTDQWYTVEVIMTAASIYGWVDGNGPTEPPSFTASAYPARFEMTVNGGTMSVDCAHASLVSIVTPDILN